MVTAAPSAAAQVIIALIPIVGIVIGGTIVFFSLLWRHSENKLRIKMGSYAKEHFNLKTYSLLFGTLLIGVGIVLTLFFALVAGRSPALVGGLLPLGIGICLIVFYVINPEFKLTYEDKEPLS